MWNRGGPRRTFMRASALKARLGDAKIHTEVMGSDHCPVELDVERMNRAAQDIVGVHDFSAFMASGGTSKTFEREMKAAQVCRAGNQVCFMVWGTGFLYNMVRILTGTLVEVGRGQRSPESVTELFGAKRAQAGFLAPAQGLCLEEVVY